MSKVILFADGEARNHWSIGVENGLTLEAEA